MLWQHAGDDAHGDGELRGELMDQCLSCRLPRTPRNHTVLHIPESHTLYVGPSSCMRRHAIHAREYGNIEDVTFLRITQADVVSGGYEELIVEAAGELLSTLTPAPRIMFIELFCIDDFLGTDDESLVSALSAAYPQCKFVADHIHPVAVNEVVNMSEMKHFNQYSFVEPIEWDQHDMGINVLGSFVPFNPESDIYDVMDALGAGPFRYLFECETFDDYQRMGASRIALVTREMVVSSAKDMQERLGIPFMSFPSCYGLEAIEALYSKMAAMLGKNLPQEVVGSWREAAEAQTESTLAVVDSLPIAVDCDATLVPHALALSLLEYGFNVRWVFRSKHMFDMDAADRDRLVAQYPEVRILRVDDASLAAGSEEERCSAVSEKLGLDLPSVGGAPATFVGQPILAIGDKAAKIIGTPYCVDMWHDEGFTGYQGVCRLMRLIEEQAVRARRDQELDAVASKVFNGGCKARSLR